MRAMANHMANPWLNVPLTDYENHMNSAGVEQSAALSALFAEALAHCQPESVAVIGVAGGNGLDRIDSSVTRRMLGIDINPAYLDAVRQPLRIDGFPVRRPHRGNLVGSGLPITELDAVGRASPARLRRNLGQVEHERQVGFQSSRGEETHLPKV